MKPAKPQTETEILDSVKKPNVALANRKPKIILGTGKHLAFVSDTLFGEDLKH